jgi:hypothetical protein
MNDARFRPTAGHLLTSDELEGYQQQAYYNAIPAGLIGKWDGDAPPRGWLWYRGTFDVSLYPRLARIYPAGQFPQSEPGWIIKF